MPPDNEEIELQDRCDLLEQASGAQERLESILGALPNVVFETDSSLTWVYLSPGWHELTGQNPQHAHGNEIVDYFAPEDRDRVRTLLTSIEKSGAATASEQVRIINATGSEVWVELQARGSKRPDTLKHHVVGTLTNIHRSKALEASIKAREQFIIAVADASRDLLDHSGAADSEAHIFARLLGPADIEAATLITVDITRSTLIIAGASEVQRDGKGYSTDELTVEEAGAVLGGTQLLMDPVKIRVTGHLGRRAQRQPDGGTRDVEVFAVSVDGRCHKLLLLKTRAFWNLAMINIMAGFCRTWGLILERANALRTLAESEERLGLAIDASNEGVWDWNIPTGRVHFSQRWCEMLGYRQEQVEPVIDSWRDNVHPADLDWVTDVIEKHMRGDNDLFETTHRMRHASGRWLWILDRGKIVERDEDGNPLRAIGTHLDVTAKQVAEERLAERTAMLARTNDQMDLMLLISPIGFMLFDGDDICTMNNRSIVDLLSIDDSLEGRSLVFIEHLIREKMVVVGDSPLNSELGLIVRNPATDSVVKLRLFERQNESGDDASLLAATDISQEHALSVAKSYFISAASHELRTPVASIVGFSDLLLDGAAEIGSDEGRRMLGAINRQAKVLESVVSQLLDISRIETGSGLNTEIVRVDLRDAVDAAVSSFCAVEMKHKVECEYQGEIPDVQLEPDNFSRVVHNLLSNACKYSPDESLVSVRVKAPEHADSGAILEIEDRGIGMSADQLERMFDPFYRVDSSRHVRGLGIGMHIVRELVTAMGMSIRVASELDKGTRVTLEIPVATESTFDKEDQLRAYQ